jgi:Fic family protein
VYTPPEGQDRLRDLLANWERFLHDDSELDPLIRMAVGHYQFEAIHPFTDGNGRTGRILNLLFLVEQQLLDQPVLYLSRAIIRRRTDYYRLLNAVTTDDAWEPWVLYVLDAVQDTATWTTVKIRAIRELLRRASAHVREHAPSLYSRELVELVFEQPYSRIGNLVDAGIAKRQTASVYLKTLCDIGVLREVKAGREKLFIHPNLMTLLTAENHKVPEYRV